MNLSLIHIYVRVVKGVNFKGVQDVEDPVALARRYNDAGADELVFYDITARVEGRGLFTDVLRDVARQIFIPLTVGGAINTPVSYTHLANEIAPEHLEVCVDDPFSLLNSIRNAGSIFLGKNVPEALGDYRCV